MITLLACMRIRVSAEKESTQIVDGKINDLIKYFVLSLHFCEDSEQWRSCPGLVNRARPNLLLPLGDLRPAMASWALKDHLIQTFVL